MEKVVQCSRCVHFHNQDVDGNTCKAFPDGIPKKIFHGDFDHRKPFKDDHGIRFKPIKKPK